MMDSVVVGGRRGRHGAVVDSGVGLDRHTLVTEWLVPAQCGLPRGIGGALGNGVTEPPGGISFSKTQDACHCLRAIRRSTWPL